MSDEAVKPAEDILSDAFKTLDDGVELFDMDAIVPSTRQWKLDGRTYTIPASIPIEMLMSIVRFEEQRDKESSTGEDEMKRFIECEQMIRDFLAEHNDDVPAKLNLGTTRMPLAITYLVRGRDAVQVSLELLAGGRLAEIEGAMRMAEQAALDAGLIEPEPGSEDAAGLPPLASPKRSPRRSSRSEKSTTGRRGGGDKKRSRRSASTSSTAGATAS